jgi:hypothetical protein
MILPDKHLSQRRSLLGVGSRILGSLDRPQTLGSLWDRFAENDRAQVGAIAVTFDYFVLALDFLFAVGCIELAGGQLARAHR